MDIVVKISRILRSYREWARPRKSHSLLTRCFHRLAIFLPFCVVYVLVPRPWGGDLGSAIRMWIWMSVLYALGDHAYFQVYGGTEIEYPELPGTDPTKQITTK